MTLILLKASNYSKNMLNHVNPFIDTHTFHQAYTKCYNGICYGVLDYDNFEESKINGLFNFHITKSNQKNLLKKVGTKNPLLIIKISRFCSIYSSSSRNFFLKIYKKMNL